MFNTCAMFFVTAKLMFIFFLFMNDNELFQDLWAKMDKIETGR